MSDHLEKRIEALESQAQGSHGTIVAWQDIDNPDYYTLTLFGTGERYGPERTYSKAEAEVLAEQEKWNLFFVLYDSDTPDAERAAFA